MNPEVLILAIILLPLLCMFGIIASRKHPNIREAVTLITASLVAILVVRLAIQFMD